MEIKQEQREVIDFNNGNILVSASAGSGKTFTMIERAVRLVLSGEAKISEILAVTFTESAAFDMKRKLREALIEKVNAELDLNKRQYLLEQIGGLDYADICTLHSFASRLIRKYFYKVNLSPDYSICDENEAEIIKSECIDKVFRQLYDSKEEWFLSLCSIFSKKRKDEKFKELILSLYDFCIVEECPEEFANSLLERYTIEGINKTNRDYKAVIDKELSILKTKGENILPSIKGEEGLNKQVQYLDSLLEDIDKVLDSDSIYVLNEIESFKNKIPNNSRQGIRAIRDKLKEIVSNVLNNLTSEKQDIERTLESKCLAEGVIKIILLFKQEFDREKREENVLDFNDLEHFAVKILEDSVEVNKEVKAKYKYIFADEYQDTNGVQERILSLVSDNNLFMVGDLKQSIYGFRGCNSDIFDKKYNDMKKDGQKTAMLNYNFRSSKKVIQLVNEIFTFCMEKELSNIDYRESYLKEGGVYDDKAEGRAQIHLLVKEVKKEKEEEKEEKPKIYNILDHLKNEDEEEDNYSALVAKIIKEERGKQYYDFKQKKYREVLNSDIAILLRSTKKGSASKLVRGLNKRGIKTISNVAENVCDFPEVKILVELIKAIDCLKNDIPLAMTMLSFIGGFTEQELLTIVSFAKLEKKEKYNNFYEAVDCYKQNGSDLQLKEKVENHINYLQSLRTYCDFNGVYDTLLKVIEDNNYKDILLSNEDGEDKVRRVERFVSASKTSTKKYTVKEFLYKIEKSPDSFLLASPADENSVKVMTMHSSKGLEFPVVIVCSLPGELTQRGKDVLQERNIGIGIGYYNKETKIIEGNPICGLIKEQLEINKIKEESRLFYVALTRAKYSLHLVFSGKDERQEEFIDAGKFFDYIPKSIEITEHYAGDFAMENYREEDRKVIVGKGDSEIAQSIKKNFDFSYPYSIDTKVSLKDNVTRVLSENEEDREYSFVKGDNKTNKDRGTLAHKIVENIDFSCDFDSEIDRLLEEKIIDKEEIKSIDLNRIKVALDNDIFKSLKGKQLYKEKCFTVNIPANILFDIGSKENVLIQGIIDLLVIDGDNAEIIDYKYSSLDSVSLKEKYSRQLELYAYAVEKVLNKKVVRKALVNIYTGEIVLD